jgi:hypothetical protein
MVKFPKVIKKWVRLGLKKSDFSLAGLGLRSGHCSFLVATLTRQAVGTDKQLS